MPSSVLYLVFLNYMLSFLEHYLLQQDVVISPITTEVGFGDFLPYVTSGSSCFYDLATLL